jgi:glutathione S-transferase
VRTKLVTIRFSHFNEKARWALDRFGVPYEEEGYLPGIHVFGVLKLAPRHGIGKRDRLSSPFGTPVMITPEGACIRDSAKIVRYVSDRWAPKGQDLYPTEEVAQLEERFSHELGGHTRRFGYFHAFQDEIGVARIAEANVGPAQARLFRILSPLIQRGIAKGLRVTETEAERSIAKVRAVMAEVGERVAGRRYLVGDHFTAADLAFACMASPILLPTPEEGYGAVWPTLEMCPPAFAEVAREMRASPAGRFALRMFREERGRRAS